MLAQAMSSTKPVIARSRINGVRGLAVHRALAPLARLQRRRSLARNRSSVCVAHPLLERRLHLVDDAV